MRKESILAIDIGGGTQDIFLYEPGKPVENCIQLILPSPTVIVAREVEAATKKRQAVFLDGQIMGGGACVGALRRHLKAGMEVLATPEAGKTIFDDLERVRDFGVKITEESPPGAVQVRTGDLDLDRLKRALDLYGVDLPAKIAVAVQDHGECPGISNREFRFRHWRDFLEQGGQLNRLVYVEIPDYLTRMQAVQQAAPGAVLMDTGAAAIWGALLDEVGRLNRDRGLVVVNIGNQHTIGALVKGDRVWGLFEHHTGMMSKEKLAVLVDKLQAGSLSHLEVFEDGGHGCHIHQDYTKEAMPFDIILVTGPNRQMAEGLGYRFAVPFGDMMLSGCFGLVAAVNGELT